MAFKTEDKWIDAAEAELKASLPQAYRAALKSENGGEVEVENEHWVLHPVWDKSDRKRMARTCNHIGAETKSMESWRGWPDGAVCIGGNGSGDVLMFISKDGVCADAVYRWFHETRDVKQVSKDFSALKRI